MAKIPEHHVDPGTVPEKVISYTYDVHNDKWTQVANKVKLEALPFEEGSMRAAFFMIDLSKQGEEAKYVAKMSKNPKEDKSTYFLDVEMQALAKLFAEEYNRRGSPKRVDFNDAAVIKCLERRGQPLLAVEPYLGGKFSKHSNNYGFVAYDDRNTPQAFSHFTYCHSGGKLLICDIQGVDDKYTDPQIHSRDGKGFGKGNLGYEGMLKFFHSHRCNSICKFLNLPQHNPKQVDRGTTPEVNAMVQRLSMANAESVQPDAAPEPPTSPRSSQPQGPPENPLDPTYLGISRDQFEFIDKNFKLCVKQGTNRIGRRGLVALCGKLHYEISLEEAAKIIAKLDTMDQDQTIDLRQFCWWWCGIEE